MPWWRESDTFADDPIWEVLSLGRRALYCELKASYVDMKARTSQQTDHGYLTRAAALAACGGRQKVLDLLCTAVLDRKPLVHREGDECECLGDSWVAGFVYRLHDFLKHNPSRAEYNRHRAQSADRRDARLRELVKNRDGLFCRYCRSGPLSAKAAGRAKDRRKVLTLDHVDPDAPAGPDGENYVAACDRCNTEKGHRTPDEADMILLPVPTVAEKHAWEQRGLALFDRPPYTPNHRSISHESTTNQHPINDQHAESINDSVGDREREPIGDPHNDPTPAVRPPQAANGSEHAPVARADPPGTGRDGPPAAVQPQPGRQQPARPAAYPDVYHRRSRASPAPPPPPEEMWWPPGATATRPTPRQEETG